MGRPRTFREDRADGAIIHLDGAEQDYSLCGYAYEGACGGDDEDAELIEVRRGKVSCPTCIRTWTYCRSIAPRYIEKASK